MINFNDWWALIMQPYDEKWGYIYGASGYMWTKAKQDALVQKYNSDPEKYASLRVGAQKGSMWIGKMVIDCSGMAYRAFKQLGVAVPHGSNSIYSSKYMQAMGRITPGIKLPKGTAVFTGTEGNHPHVGHYDGECYVIEAQQTTTGVTRSLLTNKKWTFWGCYKNLEYEFIPGKTEPQTTTPAKEETTVAKKYTTIRQGDKGIAVEDLQDMLSKLGSSLQVDGIFGSGTRSAVTAFQRKHGLTVDGIVGPQTWGKLYEEFDKAFPDDDETPAPASDDPDTEPDIEPSLEEKVNILWNWYVEGGK